MQKRWTLSEMKEIVLALLALLWGVVFYLPGEILSEASRFDLLSLYAGDATWGTLLLAGSLFLLLTPRSKNRRLRRFTHAFFWMFWLAIGTLVLYRSAENGLDPTDLLIMSPYFTLAFIHAAFYARLVYNT